MDEINFDDAIASAWTAFIGQLEQLLPRGTEELALDVLGARPGVGATVIVTGNGIGGAAVVARADAPEYAIGQGRRKRLERLGFIVRGNHLQASVGSRGEAVTILVVLLRDVWGVAHPSFARTAVAPNAAGSRREARDERELRSWLAAGLRSAFDDVEDAREGSTSLLLRHRLGVGLAVRTAGESAIEVYAMIAAEPAEDDALAEAMRLSRRRPDLEFRWLSGRLVVVATVPAAPFSARALNEVVDDVAEFVNGYRRPVEPVDERFVEMAEACRQLSSTDAVDRALELAQNSESVLRIWYRAAVAAHAETLGREPAERLVDELRWTAVSSVVAVALTRLAS